MAAPQTFNPDTTAKPFTLTERQDEAVDLLATTALDRVMLYGGSRSGKTFVGVYAVITRALMAVGSRHAIVRKHFNAVKTSVGMDTIPKVMELAYPGVPYHTDKTDWIVRFDNGSEIWLLGLDDKKRTEKVLGKEFATLYFNECSEISAASVEIALTRLAQNCVKRDGRSLKLLSIFDCNPPGRAHWTYQHFIAKTELTSKKPFAYPETVAYLQMNPTDNEENLPPAYFRTLEGLSGAARKRFLDGKFAEDAAGALWTAAGIDNARGPRPSRLRRIVVAVDPSGCSGPEDYRSDEIGIVVAGLDADNVAWVLEDATMRGSPTQWGAKATQLYRKWGADKLVAEKNYGGAMVKAVIEATDKRVPVSLVNASRGKHVRAEPIATFTDEGRFKFAGDFPELEDQLCGFLSSGYIGAKSPDRADACIWAATELLGNASTYTLDNL